MSVQYPFSLFEKVSNNQWKYLGGIEVETTNGQESLMWVRSSSRSLSGEKLEQAVTHQLTKEKLANLALPFQTALSYKHALRNFSVLMAKMQSSDTDPFGKLSALQRQALLNLEEMIETFPKNAEYQKLFIDVVVENGESIPLRRRGIKKREQGEEEIAPCQITASLKTLPKDQALSLVHFLETGFLVDGSADLSKMSAQLETFYKAVDQSECVELKEMLELRILDLFEKIRQPCDLCFLLDVAQKCSSECLEDFCVEIFMSSNIEGLNLEKWKGDQQQKFETILKTKYPEITESLLFFRTHKKLPPSCLTKNRETLKHLVQLAAFSKMHSCPDLEKACQNTVKAFVSPGDGAIAASLVFLEVCPLEKPLPLKELNLRRELTTIALRNILTSPWMKLSSKEQELVKQRLLVLHPKTTDSFIAYLNQGPAAFPTDIGKNCGFFVDLLVFAGIYQLPQLKEDIETFLIKNATQDVSTLLKLIDIDTSYRVDFGNAHYPPSKDTLEKLRAHVFDKLTADRMKDWIEKKPRAVFEFEEVLDTAGAYENLKLHGLALELAEVIKDKKIKGHCLKQLAFLPFEKLSDLQKKIAVCFLVDEWLSDPSLLSLDTEIFYFLDKHFNAIIPLIAEHRKEIKSFHLPLSTNPLSDDQLKLLVKSWTQLEVLKLNSAENLTDLGLNALAQSSLHLKKLTLKHATGITEQGWVLFLKQKRDLTHLHFGGFLNKPFTDKAVIAIGESLPDLVELNLFDLPITEEALNILAKECTKLETLDIHNYWDERGFTQKMTKRVLELFPHFEQKENKGSFNTKEH